MAPKQILDYVKDLSASDHAVMFYESVQERRSVAFEFLRTGLARGEVVWHFVLEEELDDVRDAMRRSGIDVEGFERLGRLRIVEAAEAEHYLKKGELTRRLFESSEEMIRSVESRGLEGVRVFGDITAAVRKGLVDDLIEYEGKLGRRLALPAIAICSYHAETVAPVRDGQLYLDLIKLHGHAIFPGIALKLI